MMSSLPSLMKLRRPVANDLRARGSYVITPAGGGKGQRRKELLIDGRLHFRTKSEH